MNIFRQSVERLFSTTIRRFVLKRALNEEVSKKDVPAFLCNIETLTTCCLIYFILSIFSELYLGKTMVAYTKPQQRKKEGSERLRGERYHIKFIDLRFERWQVVGHEKARSFWLF